jgi:hypothetical protein
VGVAGAGAFGRVRCDAAGAAAATVFSVVVTMAPEQKSNG